MDNLQFCEDCGVNFTSLINQQEHQNSPAHQKKVRQRLRCEDLSESLKSMPPPTENDDLVSEDKYMLVVDKNQYFCQLCRANCAGKIPAYNHIKGKPHRQKLNKLKFDPEMASLDFLNGSTFPPGSLSSAPHELQCASIPAEDFPDFEINRLTGHFFCKVCKLSMSGQVPAKAHSKGKSHLKKLRIAKEMGYVTDEISDRLSNITISGPQMSEKPSTVCASGETSDMGYKRDKDRSSPQSNMNQNLTRSDGSLGPSPGGAADAQSNDDRLVNGIGNEIAGNSINGETEAKMETFDEDLVRDKDGWTCKLCSVPLNSEKTVKQHFIGKAHLKRKKFLSLAKGQSDSAEQLPEHVETLPETGHFKCNLCNVSMTSMGPLKEHLSGKAHLKNKQVKGTYVPSDVRCSDASRSPWMASSGIVDQKFDREKEIGHFDVSASNMNPAGQSSIADTAAQMQPPMNMLSYSNKEHNPISSSPIASSPKLNDHSMATDPNGGCSQQTPHQYPRSPGDPVIPKPARPPPGFERVGLPGTAQPMADFLDHQRITSETQPSHMHNFWSMSSLGQDIRGRELWRESSGNVSPSTQVAPIGTPDPLSTDFTVDHKRMKYLCNTCLIEVSGRENARSHLSGNKHAKKVKEKQFEERHITPFVNNPVATSAQPAMQSQPQIAAANQPGITAPLTQTHEQPGSSIEVLTREGGSSSFEYSPSGSIGSYEYTTSGNNHHVHGSGVLGQTQRLDDGPMPLRGMSLMTSMDTLGNR